MTAPASAYPRTVDDLMPKARTLPMRDGEFVPSKRRLMSELKVGAPKAEEIRDRLIAEMFERDRIALKLKRDRDASTAGVTPVVDEVPELPSFDPAPPVASNGNGHRPDADATEPATDRDSIPGTPPAQPVVEATEQAGVDVGADATDRPAKARPVVVWPIWLLMLPAFVAVWAGWVELGKLTGFGPVDLLPGFTRDNGDPLATLNTAITLPIGMEVYAGYALYVWLSGRVPVRAQRFAMFSALAALALGAGAQITYHLLVTPEVSNTPWQITTIVACLPVVVLGMGAALGHLVREGGEQR